MKLELTDQETELILRFVDLGLKSQGVTALDAANVVIAKIKKAKAEEAAPAPQ